MSTLVEGLVLMAQKDSEKEPVRDEQERHKECRNKVRGS